MKLAFILCGIAILLAIGRPGTGAPIQGPSVGKGRVGPNGSNTFVQTFKGGERACVIITGDGSSYLGLYVYDSDGNCIARDDRGNHATRDDAAVEWYPPRTGRYTIEVKNLGRNADPYAIAVR
jgi:hypothetical protein